MTREEHTQVLVNKIILQNEERRLLTEIARLKAVVNTCKNQSVVNSLKLQTQSLRAQLFDVRERL
jgi:hypothetical protein